MMKHHIIDFKNCLASIPNEDFEIASSIFLSELESRGLNAKEKIKEIEENLDAIKFELFKNEGWKYAARRLVVRNIISEDYVLDLVSAHFGISVEEIKGRSRKSPIPIARNAYRYIMYNIGWGSLDEVARLTESIAKTSRHAPVINSIRKTEDLKFSKEYKDSLEFANNLVEEIKKQINDSIRNGK